MTLAKSLKIGGDGYDMLYVDTENYLDSDGVKIKKERVVDSINDFLDAFDSFEIRLYKVKDLTISDDKSDATVKFYIDFNSWFNNGKDKFHFNGDGCFKLQPSEYGGWSMYHINLPGLKI